MGWKRTQLAKKRCCCTWPDNLVSSDKQQFQYNVMPKRGENNEKWIFIDKTKNSPKQSSTAQEHNR
eukprot:3271880-Amphidinium_carterae.1